MDSKSKTSLLVLSKIILVFTSCLIPVLASSNHNEKLVSVDLYYETLCPDCGDFILNHLVKLFHTKLISLVHLNLVPYGNARLGSNHTISCQSFFFTLIRIKGTIHYSPIREDKLLSDPFNF